jgi:hypothetical protein
MYLSAQANAALPTLGEDGAEAEAEAEAEAQQHARETVRPQPIFM